MFTYEVDQSNDTHLDIYVAMGCDSDPYEHFEHYYESKVVRGFYSEIEILLPQEVQYEDVAIKVRHFLTNLL